MRPHLATLLAVALAVPAAAQVSSTRGRFRTNPRAYPGKAKVEAARQASAAQRSAARTQGTTEPPVRHNPPRKTEETFITAPNRREWEKAHARPKVFPDYKETLKAGAEAKAKAEAEAGPPPPPPPATGVVTGRSGLELMGDPRLQELVLRRRAALVRDRVEELVGAARVLDELELVREVLGRIGVRPPEGRGSLETAGISVPPAEARAGDLLFFELGEGARRSLHVAVHAGDGRFAYSTRGGVRVGAVGDARWRDRLVAVRRLTL